MPSNSKKILVTGASGFIGNHLVQYLVTKGYLVRGVSRKNPEFMQTSAQEFLLLDLRKWENCLTATEGIDYVYHLSANIGGVGFRAELKANVIRDNMLVNIHMLEAAKTNKVSRFFFSSSAAVYPVFKQVNAKSKGLKESDAYPADPPSEYGWERLFTERLCKNYSSDYDMETRIARYHNIYGPYGPWRGGRERAPAALCRKIAMAKVGDSIEIWGDGKQAYSFCYIDDCVKGTYLLMNSNWREPLNIGSDRLVTINELVDIICKIAGKEIKKTYRLDKPQGVRGRSSDNTLVKQALSWEPQVSLEEGLKKLYYWIEKQVEKKAPRINI